MRALLAMLLLALPLRAAEVRVFAAASLTEALTEIARGYEKNNEDRIVFNFGASSILARQIEQGAPGDLFLSADEAKMDALARQKLIDPQTRVRALSNTLVIVVPRIDGKRITDVRQLAEPRIESLALAEPSSVPAGIYARQYLQKLGIWARVAPKVIPTDNVRGALAAVASGNVDAAIVYRTDARVSKDVRVAVEISRAEGPAISYPFALLAEAEQPVAARRFLAHLRSSASRAIFIRHGFDVLR
ncbi:MAG: molybdate ABC transporter substrate-binding protein [Acidobacteriota bacterium]